MRIRNALTGVELGAELTTKHGTARDGQHVVVVDGQAVKPQGFEIIGCTEREVGAIPGPRIAARLAAL